jgi:hypothetical protein
MLRFIAPELSSLTANAILHFDGTDQEQALGTFYREYQGMSSSDSPCL